MKKFLFLVISFLLLSGCSSTSRNIDTLPATNGIKIKPYFSQTGSNYNLGGGIDDLIVEEIKSAKKSLRLAVFGFTNDRLRDALIVAHKKGVDVIVVTDDGEFYKDDIVVLKDAGVEVLNDENPNALMHHKFLVIDGAVVWSGSANYSYYAFYKNNENLVKITSSKIAKVYLDEFKELYEKKDYEGAFLSDSLEIYFSPEDDFEQRLIQLIEDANISIDFLAFAFTNEKISDALKTKFNEGVKIRGVFDKKQNNGFLKRYSKYNTLLSHGLDVKLDGNRQTMHNKVFIIDGKTVVTGSYNFTVKANKQNNENIIIIHNKEFTYHYLEEFETIWSLGEN